MYLIDEKNRLKVDISPSQTSVTGDFKRVTDYIDYKIIPPFLISNSGLDIYSNSEDAESYFKDTLVKLALHTLKPIALTFSSVNDNNIHIAVYLHIDSLKLKCCIIDFNIISTLISIPYINKTSFIEKDDVSSSSTISVMATGTPSIPNTSIFDKVLSRRKQSQIQSQSPQNSFIMSPVQSKTTALSSQILTTNEQITQAISKLVLSGLRLRGLSGFISSTSQVSNEKLAVREIYQMTQQCAIFAVRKFNYGFNKQSHSQQLSPVPVRLNDIQDIVENLLSVFIDMEESATTT
ncbi:hypothetical protein CLIB1423_46S00210 [[Candida] railenensis]|uniref:Sld7 C-terminal domain-containing protein n=1 Tax=[Candida] railenensis TaxID=45579 RepID=A0A9P0QW28_9ASCO|nr:hypothetical protein CLIB1423_46S00210 [[Candida] railenensis]